MTQHDIATLRRAHAEACTEAYEADNAYQTELATQGIEPYTEAARGVEGSELRELYERKVAADARRRELTDLLRKC